MISSFLFTPLTLSLLLLLLLFVTLTADAATPSSRSSRTSPQYKILATRDLSRYRFTLQNAAVKRSRRPSLSSTSFLTDADAEAGGSSAAKADIVGQNRRALENGITAEVISGKKRKKTASVKLKLYSAADFGVGEYVVEVQIGTPARKFKVYVDTGSDLTWVNCRYRRGGGGGGGGGGGRGGERRVFEAERSSSFKTVPCGSSECLEGLADLFSLTTCPSASAPCLYNYSYEGNSASAFGVFGEETSTLPLTNGNRVKLTNVIGCTQSTQGSNLFHTAVDGVLGLSYNNQSLGYRATMNYGGGKFSYCLMDHLSSSNVTNYLVFGGHRQRAKIVGRFRYTGLALGAIESFYAVRVKGISVGGGGSLLRIPRRVWDLSGPGGVIVDSGTSLTVLATPAYERVMEALTRALSMDFPSVGMGSSTSPFSYCFNSTGFRESMVPRLVVHFSDGARFRPHVKSYIIGDRPGLKCIGILEGTGFPYLSVIGNILQQNFFWEFDVAGQRLGFGSSTCT